MVAPKLTNDERLEICRRYLLDQNVTYEQLAREYGVSVAVIHHVVTRFNATGDWRFRRYKRAVKQSR